MTDQYQWYICFLCLSATIQALAMKTKFNMPEHKKSEDFSASNFNFIPLSRSPYSYETETPSFLIRDMALIYYYLYCPNNAQQFFIPKREPKLRNTEKIDNGNRTAQKHSIDQ